MILNNGEHGMKNVMGLNKSEFQALLVLYPHMYYDAQVQMSEFIEKMGRDFLSQTVSAYRESTNEYLVFIVNSTLEKVLREFVGNRILVEATSETRIVQKDNGMSEVGVDIHWKPLSGYLSIYRLQWRFEYEELKRDLLEVKMDVAREEVIKKIDEDVSKHWYPGVGLSRGRDPNTGSILDEVSYYPPIDREVDIVLGNGMTNTVEKEAQLTNLNLVKSRNKEEFNVSVSLDKWESRRCKLEEKRSEIVNLLDSHNIIDSCYEDKSTTTPVVCEVTWSGKKTTRQQLREMGINT